MKKDMTEGRESVLHPALFPAHHGGKPAAGFVQPR